MDEHTDHGVSVSTDSGVCKIMLRRPDSKNALTQEDRKALCDALRTADGDVDVRVVVITGQGDDFCSGADVRELTHRRDRAEAHAYALGIGQAVFRLMRGMDTPTIARVRGVAAGAGMYLALGSDIVVADETARFFPAHLGLGLVPDWGAVWIVPRLVGIARAKAIMLTGAAISAPQAAAWGLIADSVPTEHLDETVSEYCAQIKSAPAFATARTRRGIDGSFDKSLDDFLEWEANAIADTLASPDHQERVKQFVARRRSSDHDTSK